MKKILPGPAALPVEIIPVLTQRALSPTQIELADYVINPFKGCLAGCLYCYARSNRQIQKIDKPWGEYLYIKENFLSQLETGLQQAGRISRVLIGSTTDPFQPETKACLLTGEILHFLKEKEIPFIILTKSAEIANFIGYLLYSSENRVYLTCNSPVVRDLFEKRSSPQADRIKTAELLFRAGINTTVYISPVLPWLTDVPSLFKELAGKTARISFESYNPRLGNWPELHPQISPEIRLKLEAIYASENSYQVYWQGFVEQVKQWNIDYQFNLNFFIYPYNAYYNQIKIDSSG